MPSQFCVKFDGEVEWIPFDRYHLAEVTGERVKSKEEMFNDTVELTTEQAWELIDKWNQIASEQEDGAEYSL